MDLETAAPFINKQVFLLSDFMYEQLKRVERKETSYHGLGMSIVMFIRTPPNNIIFIREDLERIEDAIYDCIKRKDSGLYDNSMIGRGILNQTNSAFLEDFEKFTRKIAQDRVVS